MALTYVEIDRQTGATLKRKAQPSDRRQMARAFDRMREARNPRPSNDAHQSIRSWFHK